MSKITYDDKIDLHVDSSIANINKVSASDMNEIKTAVNDNADDITALDTPEKWVAVGETAPTDGRRVWFSKNERNLFNYKTIVGGDIIGADPTIRLSSRQPLYLANGTYTFSTNQPSPFRYSIQVQNVGAPPLSSYPTYILNSGWQTSSSYTFTISNPGYVVVNISKNDNTTLTPNGISNYHYQLEQGSTATTYEPYIEPSINVDKEVWYSKPKVLWSGKATSVNVDLTGYSFIEVIFCSNDNFYNSLKVPVSGSTFSRSLALCNSFLTDPLSSSGSLYLKYGKAILTQSGITIKANVEVAITNTASQIKWQGASNTLLYITNIIGYK